MKSQLTIDLTRLSSHTLSRGAVILLMESRKSTKKVPENRKKSRKFGRKPENTISESRKMGKKSAENRKTHIFVAENRKETPYYPPLRTALISVQEFNYDEPDVLFSYTYCHVPQSQGLRGCNEK